jgi:hypothetical protein
MMTRQKVKFLHAFALITLFTVLFSSSISPTPTDAHSPPVSFLTYAYLSVSPNPVVGVNQQVLVTLWIDKVPPTARGNTGDRWENFTVTVTLPDGQLETRGPFESDSAGSTYFVYTPAQVGNYSFQFTFQGQVLEGKNPPLDRGSEEFIGDYYLPSTSTKAQLTVQQQAMTFFVDTPLPSGYWTRPIEAENQQWWQIAGNWLSGSDARGRVNLYSKAPNTAHIVWTRQLTAGGIVGGEYGTVPFYDAQSYERFWGPPIIMNGVLYYNTANPPLYGFYAVDLRSGKELWWHNSTGAMYVNLRAAYGSSINYPQLSFGQLYDFESPNQHGVIPPYLWCTAGDTWYLHDGVTGNWILTIENVPFGALDVGKDGSELVYVLNPDAGWLALWNSSKAIPLPYTSDYPYNWSLVNGYWSWRPPMGATLDGSNGYTWNVTVPKIPGLLVSRLLDDRIIAASGSVQCAISVKPDEAGKLLWQVNREGQTGNLTMGPGPGDSKEGIFTMWVKETMQWYGFSMDTGLQVWGPTPPQTAWDSYGMGGALAYGKLFSYGYGGILYSYDIKKGNLLWAYGPFSGGFDVPYGQYPFFLGAIADHKIFVYSTEHSPTKPQWRGAKLRAVDVNTGQEVWSVLNWANGPAVADGYLVAANSYDNQIYCFGKGQSSVTVSAPQTVLPKGSTALIQGTVTDQSPGQKGTAAISDANMSAWMEHLYMQKPLQGDMMGVLVVLTAVGPDGKTLNIGTVTSDASGLYKTLWTQPAEGAYTIMASFAGTESYWASTAETALGVSSASSSAGSGALMDLPASVWLLGAVALLIAAVLSDILLRRRQKPS